MDSRSQASEFPPPPDGSKPIPVEDTSLPPTGPPATRITEIGDPPTPGGGSDTVEPWPRAASGRLGPYELLEEVARGGMGVVYKARHATMDRVVALKTLPPDALFNHHQAQRFDREVRVAARLNHRNIVAIYDVGRHNGLPFFTMAYLAGGSLARHRQRLQNNPRSAVALMEQVARAVQYAHEQGVVHRDLKPANVLLDEAGVPHVSDFGLAKLREGDIELTQSGAVLGTPAYMAPEQAAGRLKDVGPATDVWSLGVMLYELLTGQKPFAGESSDDVRRCILADEPPRPSAVRPGMDRGQETMILKCLEKDPSLRYASAGALADDLARWSRNEPVRVRAPGPAARVRRWVRRRPRVLALAGLAGLVVGSAFLFRNGTDPDRPLKELQRKIDRGEVVALVPARGRPAWSRWRCGQAAMTDSERGDGTLSLYGHNLSLLELLPPPLPERYLFSAEMTLLENRNGELGIYFGHTQVDTPEGKIDRLKELTVTLIGNRQHEFRLRGSRAAAAGAAPLAPVALLGVAAGLPDVFAAPSRVLLAFRRQREPDPRGLGNHQVGTRVGRQFAEAQPDWHTLAVKVTPEEIEAFWDGQSVGKVAHAELEWFATNVLDPLHAADPARESTAQGGLGLLVNRGAASFRNVVVKPLK